MSDLSCQDCGACCISDRDDESYVMLFDTDYEKLTEREKRLLVHRDRLPMALQPDTDRLSLRTKHDRRGNCRCKALRGTIGKRVSCSIYDRRPGACSKFRVGGYLCILARDKAHRSGQLVLPTVSSQRS